MNTRVEREDTWIYYVIADNPASDVRHYPDSNKLSVPGLAKPLRVQPTEYYEGEE